MVVINTKMGVQSQTDCIATQDPHPQCVEGTDSCPLRGRLKRAGTRAHLTRRFIGKGYCQNLLGANLPGTDKMGDFGGDNARLS